MVITNSVQAIVASPIECVPRHAVAAVAWRIDDGVVPLEISQRFVEAGGEGGYDFELIVLAGADHSLIELWTPEWTMVEKTVLELL